MKKKLIKAHLAFALEMELVTHSSYNSMDQYSNAIYINIVID